MPSTVTMPMAAASVMNGPTSSNNVGDSTSKMTTHDGSPTAITLSFGGVDFRLIPNATDGSNSSTNVNGNDNSMISFLQSLNSNGAKMSLQNFTGTLCVELSQSTQSRTAPTSTSATTTNIAANTSSPLGPSANGAAARRVSPTSGGSGNKPINQSQPSVNPDNESPASEPSTVLAGVVHIDDDDDDDDNGAANNQTPTKCNVTTVGTASAAAAANKGKNKKKQQGLLPFARKSSPSTSADGKGKKGSKAGSKAAPAKRNASRKSTVGKKGSPTSGKLSLTRKLKEKTSKKEEEEEQKKKLQEDQKEQNFAASAAAAAPMMLGQTAMTATQIPSQLSQSTMTSQSTATGNMTEPMDNDATGEAGQAERERMESSSPVRELAKSVDAGSPSDSLQDFGGADDSDEDEPTQDTMLMEIDNEDDTAGANDRDEQGIEDDDSDDDASTISAPANITSGIARSAPSSPLAIAHKGKHHPCARWGQTMTLIDHGRVLVYGGQTFDENADSFKTLADVHVYDMTTRKWTKPVSSESVCRTWHSATFLPERQLLISFGGDQWNEKTNKVVTTDEVMVLDTEIMLWYPPSVSGQIPSGRSGHTATLLPNTNEMVVFGGVKNNKWQNSAAVLDTTRWKWTMPKIAGSAPRPRSYHSATAVAGSNGRSRLIIFGGNDEAESFNSVHVLEASNSKMSWFHPEVSGVSPSPRSGHVAVLLEDNKTVLIYGGWDLNLDEEACKNDADMIFSDSYLLDTESWTWNPGPKVKYDGASGVPNAGAKRVGHSAVLAPSEEGAQVFVFGGRVPNDEFANDFQKLAVPQTSIEEMC